MEYKRTKGCSPLSRIFTLDGIIGFGDRARDFTPLHRDRTEARRMGFEDTPVIGADLAARAACLARETEPGPLNIQVITFHQPVYPSKEVKFYAAPCGIIEIGEETMCVDATHEHKVMSPQPRDRTQLVYQERGFWDRRRGEELRRFLDTQEKEDLVVIVAIAPSTLLQYLTRLNEKLNTCEPGGINRSMETIVYRSFCDAGPLDVCVYEERHRPVRDKHMYVFGVDLIDSDEIVARSRITCMTNTALDTRSLRPDYGLSP